MLHRFHGYREFTQLIEEGNHPLPTRSNILTALNHMVALSNTYDELWFHYSGHGTYIADQSGDERDGRDEAIVPLDYKSTGVITDDEINEYLERLHPLCRCIFIFDCCHSGTITDLPYRKTYHGVSFIENRKTNLMNKKSNIVMLSGCMDNQESADAYNFNNQGQWSGALTGSLVQAISRGAGTLKCYNLLTQVNSYLRRKGYRQIPEMSSTYDLDDINFIGDTGFVSSRKRGNLYIPPNNSNSNAGAIARETPAERRRRERKERMERRARERRERMEQRRRDRKERMEKRRRERKERMERRRKQRAERMARRQKQRAERMEQKRKQRAERMARRRQQRAERMARRQKQRAERIARRRRNRAGN